MTAIRFHIVYRVGRGRVAATGLDPRDRAGTDRAIAGWRANGSMRPIGVWRVRDHAATIIDLCGPFGRPSSPLTPARHPS